MDIWRQLDLLNTLAITLSELQENGAEAIVEARQPGWVVVKIRAFWCPKCRRLSPGRGDCGWCEARQEASGG